MKWVFYSILTISISWFISLLVLRSMIKRMDEAEANYCKNCSTFILKSQKGGKE